MTAFQIGNVVRLKSGGPKMTVKQLDMLTDDKQTSGILCEWFYNSMQQEKTFHPDSIAVVSNDAPLPIPSATS